MKVLFLIILLSSSSFLSAWNEQQHDSAAQIAGKTLATTAIATFTGGVLLSAMRVCRWSQALDNNYSFIAIAAALLYAQYKTVEQVVGQEYKTPSLYASIVTTLGMAGLIIYQGK